MATINSIQPPDLSISGGITATIDPFATGVIQEDRQAYDVAGIYNIPAGAYSVFVHNTGTEDITVNTDRVPPDETWEVTAQINNATQKHDFCPAVVIDVPVDGSVSYMVRNPS